MRANLLFYTAFILLGASHLAQAQDQKAPPAADQATTDYHAELDAALDEYNAAITTEVEKIAKSLNDAFQRAATKGDLDLAKRAQSAEKMLRENGEPPAGTFMRIAREEAQRNIQRAARKLEQQYLAVSRAILKTGNVEGAEAVVNEASEITRQSELWQVRRHSESLQRTVPAAPNSGTGRLQSMTNSVGVQLQLILPGTFRMGDDNSGDESLAHQVTLTKPFYIGIYEITNAQWKRVMGSEPSKWKDDDRPVEGVSWEEATEFCRKLSALPEERKAGREYRLPTEAEWEYVCRAGTTTKYSFGDDESQLGEYAWFKEWSDAETHPVGRKKPNRWGLYDMHGNVCEWCSDGYGPYPKGAMIDPRGHAKSDGRAVRGGSWDWPASSGGSARRHALPVSSRYNDLGFRLALSPSGSSPPQAGVR